MKADLELRPQTVEAKCAIACFFPLLRPTQNIHLILDDAWRVAYLAHSEKSLRIATRFLPQVWSHLKCLTHNILTLDFKNSLRHLWGWWKMAFIYLGTLFKYNVVQLKV